MRPLLAVLALLLAVPAFAGEPEPAPAGSTEPAEPPAAAAGPTLQELADELRPVVSRLRGLPWKAEVPAVAMDVETLRAFVREQMAAAMPAERLALRGRVLKRLGLLPPDFDLGAHLEELLVEQVAALYDPQTRTMRLVQSIGPYTDRMILVHELTHALDDQHVPLWPILEAGMTDEEAGFVGSAVLEGSATLLMTRWVGEFLQEDPSRAAAFMAEMTQGAGAGSEKLLGAPLYLQRGLVLTYLTGQYFLTRGDVMAALMGSFDPKQTDLVYASPPRSSEQILHPEKYWDEAKRDDPVRVLLPDAGLGADWTRGDETGFGEIGLTTFMQLRSGSAPTALEMNPADPATIAPTHPASVGWDGDHLEAWTRGDELALLWGLAFDSDAEAEEFATAFAPRDGEWLGRRGALVLLLLGDFPEKGPSSAKKLGKRLLAALKTEG